MTSQQFEVKFTADAEYTSGPTYEAMLAAQQAEQEQEETQGEEPNDTEEPS